MAYRFEHGERFADGLLRIGREQIKGIARELGRHQHGASSIHEARKSLKRLRALLRLVQPIVGERWWRCQDAAYGAIGRALAGRRNVDSLLACLQKLQSDLPDVKANAAVGVLTEVLHGRLAMLADAEHEEAIAQARRSLQKARSGLMRADLSGGGFRVIGIGLAATFDEARLRQRQAFAHPADEAFHAWRKQVQRHWRHMQLLHAAWPEEIGLRIELARELSGSLGDANDLGLLLGEIERQGARFAARAAARGLREACLSRQAELRDLAGPRGKRLFAEDGATFARRIKRYWQSPIAPLAGD